MVCSSHSLAAMYLKHVKTRTTCRSCGSSLYPLLSLGNQYVSNFVDGPLEKYLKAPLELVLCDQSSGGCGLLQLKHTVRPELMFTRYWYLSGINEAMIAALQNVARKAEQMVELSEGDVVLDIGCNDGTLLRSYGPRDVKLVGFEPARNLISLAEVGTTKIINDFFNFESFEKHFGGRAKIITSIAMFYDLDNPNKFVEDIARCLDPQGVWVVQMSYLPSMLEQNAFDNICHEHLEYYSMMALRNLLERHHLGIFDVELNDVNGGSFRVYVKHANSRLPRGDEDSSSRLKEVDELEKSLGLDRREPYEKFRLRVQGLKKKLHDFIKAETQQGKTIYVYGASTKGNTLLQFCNLNHRLIKAAADRNPAKWGKKTVGTLIPIISEEQARADKPDYFLILPWHFLRVFRQREQVYLRSGGKFIVPLPEFQVING